MRALRNDACIITRVAHHSRESRIGNSVIEAMACGLALSACRANLSECLNKGGTIRGKRGNATMGTVDFPGSRSKHIEITCFNYPRSPGF
ncbi:MAG: hypothetical protein ABFD12_12015 [Syntrophorhabdus sp.]